MRDKAWFRTPAELLRQRLTFAQRERIHARAAVDVLTLDGTSELRRRATVAALAELDRRIEQLEAKLARTGRTHGRASA